MKKIYLVIVLFLSVLALNAQCNIDTNNVQAGFTPVDTSLPGFVQGSAVDTFIQFYSPAFVNDTTDTLHILSTAIDTIFGLPNGITYVKNPASNTISPNGRQCIQFTGA